MEDEGEVRESLANLKLSSRLVVVAPVNDNENVARTGGSHWSALIWISKRRAFYYFDSLGTCNKRAALRVAQKLLPLLCADLLHQKSTKVKLQEVRGPSLNEISSQRTPIQIATIQSSLQADKNLQVPFILMQTPQQSNSYDCGAYVLCIAEFFAKNLPRINYDEPERLLPLLHQEVTPTTVQQKRASLSNNSVVPPG
jgi:Ulp1 family protease